MYLKNMPSRGDIVLIPFPFSDLTGQKIRPAVILSKDNRNDVILVFITSKNKITKPTVAVPIEPTKTNGLKVSSMIICDKIATLDKKIILGSIGVVDTVTMKKVSISLKQILDL